LAERLLGLRPPRGRFFLSWWEEHESEGVNDPADRLSPPFIPIGIENFAATFCEEPAQLSDPPLLPIENGNVQIR